MLSSESKKIILKLLAQVPLPAINIHFRFHKDMIIYENKYFSPGFLVGFFLVQGDHLLFCLTPCRRYKRWEQIDEEARIIQPRERGQVAGHSGL